MGYRLDKNSKKRKIKNERWRNKYLLVAVLFTLSIISNSILPKPLLASAMENKKYEVEIASVEDSIKSEEELFELSRQAEKDDNGNINITLEVKVNKDKLPIIEKDNLEEVESIKETAEISKITLNEYIAEGFEITKDSLIVETIEGENTKELNLEELKDNNSLNVDLENKLNISLSNITSEKINFKYKINTNDNIQVADNISLTKDDSETEKTEFKYYLSEDTEKSIKLPKVCVNVKEVIVENPNEESVTVEDSVVEEPTTNNEAITGEENEGISIEDEEYAIDSYADDVDYGSYQIDSPEIIDGVNSNREGSMYFPITIRDFKADFMIFEPFDRSDNPLLGSRQMVPETLGNDKKIVVNEDTINAMAIELYAQLNGKTFKKSYDDDWENIDSIDVKIQNFIDGNFVPDRPNVRGYASGYTGDLNRRVRVLKNKYGSYNLGEYDGLDEWYNTIENADYDTIRDQIDTVYKYVYYHMHKLFDTTPGLNYTITGKKLNLVKKGTSNQYEFDSGDLGKAGSGFFPIDDVGFLGDYFHDAKNYDPDNDVEHNFHFTVESHSTFYVDGTVKEFEFSGDDDFWVYLNGNLVINLGGLHPKEKSKFVIDEDGNIKVYRQSSYTSDGYDQVYSAGTVDTKTWVDFDFYYMERHTEASNLKITTNIEFHPPEEDIKASITKTVDSITRNNSNVDFEIKDDYVSEKLLPGDIVRFKIDIKNNSTKTEYNMDGTSTTTNIALDGLSLNDILNIGSKEIKLSDFKMNDETNLGSSFTLGPNETLTVYYDWNLSIEDANLYRHDVINTVQLFRGHDKLGESIVKLNIQPPSLTIVKNVNLNGYTDLVNNRTFTIMVEGTDGTKYNIEAKNGIEYTLKNLKYGNDTQGVRYTISEIVPMNYNLTKIEGSNVVIIPRSDTENDKKNRELTVGITNSNKPLVKLTNEKVNDSYWTSENKVINVFEFNGNSLEFVRKE